MTLDEIEEMMTKFLADVRKQQEAFGKEHTFPTALVSMVHAGFNIMVNGCTVLEQMQFDDFDLALKSITDLREVMGFLTRTVDNVEYVNKECLRIQNAGRN